MFGGIKAKELVEPGLYLVPRGISASSHLQRHKEGNNPYTSIFRMHSVTQFCSIYTIQGTSIRCQQRASVDLLTSQRIWFGWVSRWFRVQSIAYQSIGIRVWRLDGFCTPLTRGMCALSEFANSCEQVFASPPRTTLLLAQSVSSRINSGTSPVYCV